MEVCDICDAPGKGAKISPNKMRDAVARGFKPFAPGSRYALNFQFWRDNVVQASTTDWNLCEKCASKIEPFLDGDPKLASAARPAPIPGSNILAGHEERVMDVAISPDGDRVLTSSWDKTVRLWDFATGKQLVCFRDHTSFVASVALAPDGRTAASGGGDVVIRLWDIAQGQVRHRLKGHSFTVFSLQFSRDGSSLLSGSGDGTVRLWDVRTGKEVRRFAGLFRSKQHKGGVQIASFSPEGSRALSVGADMVLWDVKTGKPIRTFAPTPLWSAAFLDEVHAVVSGPGVGGWAIFDLTTGSPSELLSGIPEGHGHFALTRNGQLIAGAFTGAITVFDLKSRAVLLRREGHTKHVTSIAASTDGRRAASASDDWTARTWQIA